MTTGVVGDAGQSVVVCGECGDGGCGEGAGIGRWRGRDDGLRRRVRGYERG